MYACHFISTMLRDIRRWQWILAHPLEILEKIYFILAQWDTLLENRGFIRKNKIILEDL